MNGAYTVFKWVLTTSLMASVLICIILLVKRLIGTKLGVAWHYYIWILLFIRLAVPFVPQSSISMFNLVTPFVESPISTIEDSQQGENLLNSDSKINSTAGQTNNNYDLQSNNNDNYIVQSSYSNINLETVLIFLWLSGVFAFSFYMIILNRRFGIRLKAQQECRDLQVMKVVNECSKAMNIRAEIPVFYAENIHSPLIYGLIRPRLILPQSLTACLDSRELSHIFLHELAHYKQKDILINWIAAILKAIHWFNPIIWYGFYIMRQDCELACDALALSHIEKSKQVDYGRTIVQLLSLVSADKFVPNSAGILSGSGKLQIRRRITMISNFKGTTLKCSVVVALIAAVIGATTLTNARYSVPVSINTLSDVSTEKSIMIPRESKDAATLWAEALNVRDGGLRFSLLSTELKRQEYDIYSKINWTIGGSSPWVVSYTVDETNKLDNDTYEYEIKYKMTTSEGKYDSHESVTVKKFGSSWFVIKHDKYPFDSVYMPEVTRNDSLDIKVAQQHKNSSLVTKDAEGAVNLWAEALKYRNGSARFSILNSKLKDQEYQKYNNMNWVIGGSSPWVTDYSIKQLSKIDDNNYEYEIDYTMTDSTKKVYYSKENVTVTKLRNWVISNHDDYDYLPELNNN